MAYYENQFHGDPQDLRACDVPGCSNPWVVNEPSTIWIGVIQHLCTKHVLPSPPGASGPKKEGNGTNKA